MAGQLCLVFPWPSAIIFALIMSVHAQDHSGFISIDCGAMVDYTDTETGIYYLPDKDFIDSGTNAQISSSVTPTSVQLKDLRSFPEGIKNCYTLTPKQGKDSRYAIRARFFYGNYDGKNQAPTFDLNVGINKWITIDPDGEEDYDDWWDITFVSPTNYISVCLLNTGSGVPFISALELRAMPNAIYDAGPSMALDAYRRYDAGHQTKNLVRYEGDVYDRLWRELLISFMDCVGDCVNITSTSTIDVRKSNDLYKPPPELLTTAARAPNKTYQLGFHMDVSNYVSRTEPMYVYFHFAEIEKLKLGQKREMFISSGRKNLHESFTLEYLVPQTIGPIELPIVRGEIQFSIESQKQSGLSPIVSGIEIFRVLELHQGVLTDSQDVDAVMDINETYNLTRKWRGDPCVNSSWDGISCCTSEIPRIITLNLNSSNLAGGIATSINNLTALQNLDLSNNNLTGPIPEFLARLPSLKFLNLAGNNLTGSVPKALLHKSISGALTLRLGNNTNLCVLDSCKGSSKRWPINPVVISASVFMLLLVIALVIWGTLKMKAMKKAGAFKSKSQEFSHSQITIITENFKTVIGEGGFGKVYFGTLANGLKVAVKLLSSESRQGVREFSQEIKLLMRVHHGNVVSLVGYCSNPNNMALVYEYMPGGNLKRQLSDSKGVVLSWNDRIEIAAHAAQGLYYLHNSCVPPIIHCDLKTSNILLDEKKLAKLADFGLSKAFKHEDATHVTATNGAGTPGYIDPVHEETPKFSRRSDMYSFGVVLLELITGKPALIGGFHGVSLLDWVLPQYNNGDIPSIVDERLHGNFSIDGSRNLLMIAISCLNTSASERPGINEVLAELKQCLAKENNQRQTIPISKPKYNSVGSSLMSYEVEMSQPSAR
ncbi:hypothetical protein QQ045_032633 [Rhodiola kirilowii]